MINIVRGKNNLAMVEKCFTPTIEVSIGFRQLLEKAVREVKSYGDAACMTSTAPWPAIQGVAGSVHSTHIVHAGWHRDTTRASRATESIITVSNDDVFAIQGRTLHWGLIVMCKNDCGNGGVANKL